MAVLAGEQADGPHLRREKFLGGEQEPGADPAPLPVGGDHQPQKLRGFAADAGADAGNEPARFTDAPGVAGLLAELGTQIRQGLCQRRHVKILVSLCLSHECRSLQRQHLTGVTRCERRQALRLIHS